LPQYEQTLLGYTAEKAGETLSVGAIAIVPVMPVVGWLLKKVAARWLVAAGFALSTYALHVMTQIEPGVAFSTLTGWRVLQALGLALLFVPITTSMYVGLPPERNEEAAALLNLARNLGGGVGISLIETLLARRTQAHQSVLVEHATVFDRAYRATIQAIEHGVGASPSLARLGAGRVYQELQRQALALAYVDVMRVLAVIGGVAVLVALLLKANPPGRGPAAA